jgi:HAD superfamily hydrolase (TIGR01509 family)
MNSIKAVLFDLDGVLIDATDWHFESLNRALGLFGYEISRFDHLSTYNGLPTRTKLDRLTVEKGLPRSLHPLISRAKQIYTKEIIYTNCRPSFDKEYLLSRLKRDGYRLAVCSNAIRESVELMLSQAGLLKYFEFVISNEDVALPKPDPAIYQLALSRMELRPEEAVIVEDAPHGVEAARKSGAHVLEVAGFSEVDYWRLQRFLKDLAKQGAPC